MSEQKTSQKQDFKKLQNTLKRAASLIKNTNDMILCISHIDADGLTSAGIIGRALHREGKRYHIRSVRQLELPIISELATMHNYETIIFTDLGAGQLDGINEYLSDRKIIILDHHPPITEPASDSIINITPFDYGYDGACQISGSGMAYFFAKTLNPANHDSAAIAIVGALADRQDKGPKSSLVGLNREIVEEGKKQGIIEEKLDIRLFGSETRPIHKSLEYTTDPFIPGLSGNGDMCNRFLRDTGIPQQRGDEWRTIQDLSQGERQKLVQELITFGLSRGMSVEDSQNILGYVYRLQQEKAGTLLRDAREFGSLLNSCGRLGATGIAIGICMGERRFLYEEAQEILAEYRKKISEFLGLVTLDSEHLQELPNILVFDAKDLIDDTMIGTIISIAISAQPFIDKNKPMVGLAQSDDGTVKISCRGTPQLVTQGLSFGDALRVAVEKLGPKAEGGGHDIAAGARIPQGTEDIFIESLNMAIEEQLMGEK
ncbi:MAG: DHH family phosphoesterase [Asgard group archaeon]|nr:DHH family phosphoesterase [Asgard group archaeon]